MKTPTTPMMVVANQKRKQTRSIQTATCIFGTSPRINFGMSFSGTPANWLTHSWWNRPKTAHQRMKMIKSHRKPTATWK
jgi:hypothetical protein